MTNEQIEKKFPVGKTCLYYNKLAYVSSYERANDGTIVFLNLLVESYRSPTMKAVSPSHKGLRSYHK